MNQITTIQHYPVFRKGTFQQHPDLFSRFEQNCPIHLKTRYDRIWQMMPHFEETITWPLLKGPGFWGATHPGADTVFVNIMVGIDTYVYDSDCLYVNQADWVFAISDPPGITTGSRRLFQRLDSYLKTGMTDIEALVNRLNKEIHPDEGATLSLVHLPVDKPGKAQYVVAGDSFLFQGNMSTHSLKTINGTHDFIGTPHVTFEVREIETKPGDFFLIASDGILSLAYADPSRKLGNAFLGHLNGNINDFIYDVVTAANNYYEETIYDRKLGRFGGNDNVSILLVMPEDVKCYPGEDSTILGGYISELD